MSSGRPEHETRMSATETTSVELSPALRPPDSQIKKLSDGSAVRNLFNTFLIKSCACFFQCRIRSPSERTENEKSIFTSISHRLDSIALLFPSLPSAESSMGAKGDEEKR